MSRTAFRWKWCAFSILCLLLVPVLAGEAAPAAQKPLWTEHKILPGEDLQTISKEYHIKAESLLWCNGLLAGKPLPVGTVLLIPHSTSEIPATLAEVRKRKAAEQKAAQALAPKAEAVVAKRPLQPAVKTAVVKESLKKGDAAYAAMLASMSPEQRKLFLPTKAGEESDDGVPSIEKRSLSKAGFAWPVLGRVSSFFGGRKSRSGRRSQFHNGIDIPAPKGTPILAAKSGVVVGVGTQRGYGQRVLVDHGDGTVSLYAHCSKIFVKKGQRVAAGQKIAAVGRTGRATCNHLHFTIYVKGKARNPLDLLPKKAK